VPLAHVSVAISLGIFVLLAVAYFLPSPLPGER